MKTKLHVRGVIERIAHAAIVVSVVAASPAVHAVTIEMVTVGNPGNAPDTLVMDKPNGSLPGDGTSGYGSVGYTYRISKTHVTNAQYVNFLNAVDLNGTNSLLYIPNMTNLTIGGTPYPAYTGGIDRNLAAAEGSRYSVKTGQENYPVVQINWSRAARFVNWLANGQGSGGTESGVYDMSVFTGNSFATPPSRAAGAQIFLPSEDEYYKAAYYDPTKSGTGGYWQYGTRSDTAPASIAPPGTSNSANIGAGTNGASGGASALTLATTGASFDKDTDYLTNVGAYTAATSYYGLFDLDGLVFNWTEATRENRSVAGQMLPIYRGGSWQFNELNSGAAFRNTGNGAGVNTGQFQYWGFRVAAVPEPSTYAMALAGLVCGGWQMVRRRKLASSRRLLLLCAVIAIAVGRSSTPTLAQSVNYELVTVGNPGNANDTTGYGAVADSFQIMQYECTNALYVQFLNAVDPDGINPNVIWNSRMGIGIGSNAATGSKYAAHTNMGDKPVYYVSWWDAARVANWMHNGAESYGSSDSLAGAPQNTGAYTLGTATSGTAMSRNANARFYIPTEDQWYKAAYYKAGGTNAGYWDYATQSDEAPTPVTSGSTGIGSAGNAGNYANYGTAARWDGKNGNVTSVGTNGGPSAYGVYDMGGNVYEWNDLTGVVESSRGLRGGYAYGDVSGLSSSDRLSFGTSDEADYLGFRLASPVAVPEPSTWVMALAGLACAGWQMVPRRRAKASLTQPDAAAQSPATHAWR